MRPFAALADDTRLGIVTALRKHERSVGELVELFPLTQPAISRHLRILRDAELVISEPVAQRRIYRLNPRGLREIDRWLEPYRRFWSTKLDALEQHLDEKP